MPTTDYSNLPYPSGAAAPAAAADIMALAEALKAKVVLSAVDEADRDSRHGDAPKDTLVVSADSSKVWLKTDTATPTWTTIWEDIAPSSTGIVPAAGWELTSLTLQVRGGWVDLSGDVVRTGGDLGPTVTAGAVGNLIGDPLVVTIPAAQAPTVRRRFSGFTNVQSWGMWLAETGTITLTDGYPGATLSSGESLMLAHSWPRP